jgi:predicted glycosyltransferase
MAHVKVWVDILTPKQLLFSIPLINGLKGMGLDVLCTTRDYFELNRIAESRRIDLVTVGRHGGRGLEEKLQASITRMNQLTKMLAGSGCSLSLSFMSPEQCRVAFGMGIRQITIGDSPHAESVARLTIPFTATLFTPWIIPRQSWTRFGIDSSRIIKYHALDPLVWINSADDDLGIELPNRKIITVRLEESEAAYLSDVDDVGIKIVRALCKRFYQHDIVVLPRYQSQYAALKDLPVIIPKSAFDGIALLKKTDVFIGLGGTMTVEAAMLGVPCISAYPGASFIIEQFLSKRGLIVKASRIEDILHAASEFLSNVSLRDALRVKAAALRSGMVNPVDVILKHLPLKGGDKS